MTTPTLPISDTETDSRKRARFIDTLYGELRKLGWETVGAKETWDEKANKAKPMNGVTIHRAATAGTAGLDYGLKNGVLNDIYRDSANVVAPRSYESERENQALRWISTMTFRCLNELDQKPVEVQAAVHNDRLYIAANSRLSNNKLGELVKAHRTGDALVTYILNELGKQKLKFSPREERHRDKLRGRLLPGGTATATYATQYPQVLKALKKPVTVCTDGPEGLHAERRISQTLTVTPVHIAGVKRPCVACYLSLFQGTGIHPGPYWPSEAANIDIPAYAERDAVTLAALLHKTIPDTYVTLHYACSDYSMKLATRGANTGLPLKKNSATDEVNSDSDSDEEGMELEPAKKNLKRSRVEASITDPVGGDEKRLRLSDSPPKG